VETRSAIVETHRLGAALVAAMLAAGATSACTGSIGDPGEKGPDLKNGPPVDPSFSPPAASLRRLLSRHFVNSGRDLLGADAAVVADPPNDKALNGFDSIGAATFSLGDADVARYETSARAVAAAAMGDEANLGALVGCTPAGPDDAACHEEFVRRFGRRVFRRPLEAVEVEAYVGLAQQAATDFADFYAGVEYAVAAFLQSPNFLYQVEIGETSAEAANQRVLTATEVASRMSFFLLDTTPSDALLDAAAAGDLATRDGVREAARMLLEEDAARAAIGNFYGEVFRLRDLEKVPKDAEVFPQFSPALAQAMREETLALIEDVVWDRDADFLEVLDAPYTYANAELGALYGVEVTGDGFEKVDLPAEQGRGGLFGQASFLTVFGHATTTSPTLRGRFIRETILCQSIPAPPNDVVTEFPPDSEAQTMRQKLEAHRTDPSCSGCHVLMDGIGLGLENFDGLGVYRTTENGATIDAVSVIDEGGETFEGAAELGTQLREHPAVPGCIVRNVFRGATGHVETAGEAGEIAALEASFSGSGHRLQDLLVELVASDGFRIVGAGQ
jgi:hypothetical protein